MKKITAQPDSLRDKFNQDPKGSLPEFKIEPYEEIKKEPEQEEAVYREDSAFPSTEKDIAESEQKQQRLTSKKDAAILNDAKVLAIELQKFCEGKLRTAQQLHQEVENFLNGTIKEYIEASSPGATVPRQGVNPERTPKLTPVFQQAAGLILDTQNVWITVLREQHKQTGIYREIFKKLRLPEFRLPATLEAWIKNTSVLAIERQREERMHALRKKYWTSKQLTKTERNVLFKEIQKDMAEKTNEDVASLLGRVDQQRTLLNVFKRDKNFQRNFHSIVHKLLQNYHDLSIMKRVPDEIKGKVAEELTELITDYNKKTRSPIEINPKVIGDFVEGYITDILPNLRMELANEYKFPADSTRIASLVSRLRNLKVFAQEAVAEEPGLKADIKTDHQQGEKLLEELFEYGEKTIVEMSETITEIFSYLNHEDFVPALETLGKRWQQKNPEGTQRGEKFFTREGDGERLLLAFDQRSGLVMEMNRIVAEFFELAPNEIKLGIVRIAEMLGVDDDNLPGDLREFKDEEGNVQQLASPTVKEEKEGEEHEEAPKEAANASNLQKTIQLSRNILQEIIEATKIIQTPFPRRRAPEIQDEAKKQRVQRLDKIFESLPGLKKLVEEAFQLKRREITGGRSLNKILRFAAQPPGFRPADIGRWSAELLAQFEKIEQAQDSDALTQIQNDLERIFSPRYIARHFGMESGQNPYKASDVEQFLENFYKHKSRPSRDRASIEKAESSSVEESKFIQEIVRGAKREHAGFIQRYLEKVLGSNPTQEQKDERLKELAKRFHPSYEYSSNPESLSKQDADSLIREFRTISTSSPIVSVEDEEDPNQEWLRWADHSEVLEAEDPTEERDDQKTPGRESLPEAEIRANASIDKPRRNRLIALHKIQQTLLLKRS